MADKEPISINEILAVADHTARHSLPWLRGSLEIRPLTVRELLRLIAKHPGLGVWIEGRRPFSDIDDIASVVGRAAMVAVLALSTGRSAWRLNLVPDIALVHGLVSVSEISIGLRPVTDFFLEKQKTAPQRQLAEGEVFRRDPADTRLMSIVHDATEYTLRTGRDGLDLSPAALAFAIRKLAELDRDNRMNMARAFAAIHSKEAAESVTEI